MRDTKEFDDHIDIGRDGGAGEDLAMAYRTMDNGPYNEIDHDELVSDLERAFN